jgi:hypothetical protein
MLFLLGAQLCNTSSPDVIVRACVLNMDILRKYVFSGFVDFICFSGAPLETSQRIIASPAFLGIREDKLLVCRRVPFG